MPKKHVIIILSKQDRKERADKVDEHAAHMLLTMRKNKGFTQEYMAGRSGLSLVQYRLYEGAVTSIKLWNVDAFANILGVSPIRFFLPCFQYNTLFTKIDNQMSTLGENVEAVQEAARQVRKTCQRGIRNSTESSKTIA